ncbi:MAG: Hsp20/alpha crystallin family protein [Rhodospirillaceae bacterium]
MTQTLQTSDGSLQRTAAFNAGARTPIARVVLSANVTLVEYADCYQVVANLHDVSEEDTTVSFKNHVLSIAGDDLAADTECDLAEMNRGSFRYNLGLPEDADEDNISRRYDDGMLVLTIDRLRA